MKKIIYDLGANNGDDIPYYLIRADLVVAVEANPILCDQIRIRFQEPIKRGALVVENSVISAERTTENVPFYIHKINNVLSQFPRPSEHELPNFNEVSLPSIHVVDLIHTYGEPYYIKIDIEHYDHIILRYLFENGIRPPYISAESHTIDVFCILVAMGEYNSFKMVDGENLHVRYANQTFEIGGKPVNFSFPFHAAGPFGNDIEGSWMTANNFWRVLSTVGLGWRDIHASRFDIPDESYAPMPRYQVRTWVDY